MGLGLGLELERVGGEVSEIGDRSMSASLFEHCIVLERRLYIPLVLFIYLLLVD